MLCAPKRRKYTIGVTVVIIAIIVLIALVRRSGNSSGWCCWREDLNELKCAGADLRQAPNRLLIQMVLKGNFTEVDSGKYRDSVRNAFI